MQDSDFMFIKSIYTPIYLLNFSNSACDFLNHVLLVEFKKYVEWMKCLNKTFIQPLYIYIYIYRLSWKMQAFLLLLLYVFIFKMYSSATVYVIFTNKH